jgi:uncharacterized membrane protein
VTRKHYKFWSAIASAIANKTAEAFLIQQYRMFNLVTLLSNGGLIVFSIAIISFCYVALTFALLPLTSIIAAINVAFEF